MTTPKGIDRSRLNDKLVRLSHRAIKNDEIVEKTLAFADTLSDAHLSKLVRLAGVACHVLDHCNNNTGTERNNLHFIFDSIDKGESKRLLPLISNIDIISKTADFSEMADVTQIMEDRGHDPQTDTPRLRAHLSAIAQYYPLISETRWLYIGNEALVNLVDRRPEDVDVIFELRNEKEVEDITDEILDEFKAVHSSLNVGWL